MDNPSSRSSGFTLIELLVVVAIVALLASLVAVSANKALARARMVRCSSQMKSLSTALLSYTLETRYQTLPVALDRSKPSGQWAWSFRLVDADVFPDYNNVGELLAEQQVFHCPEDRGSGSNRPSYAINAYISASSGPFEAYRYLSSLPDSSQTVLLGEVWGRRDDKSYSSLTPGSSFAAFDRHTGSTNVAFADGHVASYSMRFLQQDPDAWNALWRPDL